jgi:hypothetical protein
VEDPKPLCQVCVNRDPCWQSAPDARRESADGDGSLCLPWIGPRYQPGGVAIVGVNPNIGYEDQTDLTSEYWISYDQHIRYLAAGYRRTPSRFAYGAYRSAAALLDAAAGRPITDRDPDQLPDAVLRTARLQAVKCVPKRRNSNPADEMWERCPPMLLASELDILRPGRILVTGADPRVRGLEMIDGYRAVPCRAADLWRGVLTRAGYEAQVYGSFTRPTSRASATKAANAGCFGIWRAPRRRPVDAKNQGIAFPTPFQAKSPVSSAERSTSERARPARTSARGGGDARPRNQRWCRPRPP